MYYRCINDMFRYCKIEPKLSGQILEKETPQGIVKYGGVCEHDPATCVNIINHNEFWQPMVDRLDNYKASKVKEETK